MNGNLLIDDVAGGLRVAGVAGVAVVAVVVVTTVAVVLVIADALWLVGAGVCCNVGAGSCAEAVAGVGDVAGARWDAGPSPCAEAVAGVDCVLPVVLLDVDWENGTCCGLEACAGAGWPDHVVGWVDDVVRSVADVGCSEDTGRDWIDGVVFGLGAELSCAGGVGCVVLIGVEATCDVVCCVGSEAP